jgi:hypothetical protein
MCGIDSLIFEAASATEIISKEFEEYNDIAVRVYMITIQEVPQRITKNVG